MSKRTLDPFCLTSETDSRFLLLVMTVAGTTLNLGALVLVAVTKTESTLIEFTGAAALVLALFAWAWVCARRQAARQIERDGLAPFPPSGVPPAEAPPLAEMSKYLHRTVGAIPELEETPVQFLWDGEGLAASGVTFGFGKRRYVCLRPGLLVHWLQHKLEAFRAVLLHELGHVANRDLAKTTFSIQLGRCFQWTTAALLLVLDGMLVRRLLLNWIQNKTVSEMPAVVWSIVLANVKALAILLLVEMIRSSILRVREFYADARAGAWLGRVAPLFGLLREDEGGTALPAVGGPWGWAWRQFRTRLAPLHPTHEARRVALMDRRWLFRPSREVAFFAGLLIGVALNSSFLALNAFQELPEAVARFSERFMGNGAALYELVFAGALITLAQVLLLFGIAVMCAIYIVVPLIGTLGVQLQRAAIADRVLPGATRLSGWTTIARLAGLAGGGAVLGFWLTPVENAFSMRGRSLWLAPVYMLGWGLILAAWLALLSRLSRHFLGGHTGPRFPRQKRRCLALTAAVALLPALLAMTLTQATLTLVVEGLIELNEANGGAMLLRWLVLGWLCLPFVSAGIWGLGWLRLVWLDKRTAAPGGEDWALASRTVPRLRPPSAPRAPAPLAPPPL